MPKLDKFPAMRACSSSSETRIKCFYMFYNHKSVDRTIMCLALDKETGDTRALTILPAPEMKNPPPIYMCCTVVALGSTVYLIGGYVCHKARAAVRFFDLLCPEKGWRVAAPMHFRRIRPMAAAIDGKIYVFGSDVDGQKDGECFDPKTNRWVLLPSAGHNAAFSYIQSLYVGPDGGKSILVHSECDRENLYAYPLATQKWELFSRDFFYCRTPAAVVGDIMYALLDGPDTRQRPLHGYHLIHKKWIPVEFDQEIEIFTEVSWVIASGSDRLCLLWYHFDVEGYGKNYRYECLELRIDNSSYTEPGSEMPRLSASIVSRTYFRVKLNAAYKTIIAL